MKKLIALELIALEHCYILILRMLIIFFLNHHHETAHYFRSLCLRALLYIDIENAHHTTIKPLIALGAPLYFDIENAHHTTMKQLIALEQCLFCILKMLIIFFWNHHHETVIALEFCYILFLGVSLFAKIPVYQFLVYKGLSM